MRRLRVLDFGLHSRLGVAVDETGGVADIRGRRLRDGIIVYVGALQQVLAVVYRSRMPAAWTRSPTAVVDYNHLGQDPLAAESTGIISSREISGVTGKVPPPWPSANFHVSGNAVCQPVWP